MRIARLSQTWYIITDWQNMKSSYFRGWQSTFWFIKWGEQIIASTCSYKISLHMQYQFYRKNERESFQTKFIKLKWTYPLSSAIGTFWDHTGIKSPRETLIEKHDRYDRYKLVNPLEKWNDSRFH